MSGESNFKQPWSDNEYLITQGDPYMIYDDDERKYKIAMRENIFIYESGGEVLKNCFEQEIIVDENPSEKDIFTLKLKGDTQSDSHSYPKDN